jgi:Gpi18-like mannosyltransferase
MVIPAWLQGRPILDLLQIYLGQMADNHAQALSVNAPNPYIFFSGNPPASATLIGAGIAFLVGLGFALAAWKRDGIVTKERLILEATLVLTLMPFVLPKMHERYFFPATAFMLLLMWLRPGYWWTALLFQVTSYLSYLPFLFLGDRQTLPVVVGALGNMVILIALFAGYFRQPGATFARSGKVS